MFSSAQFGSCTSACKGSCIQNIASSSARVCSSIWHPLNKTETKRWTERRRQQPGGPACDGGTGVASTICWTNSSGHPWRTSLTFSYKIHSGTVSLDKDRYLTPAPNLKSTRACHDSQYTRYMAYSDALKNSFYPRTIPLWNSLPSSGVASKTAQEFKALIWIRGSEVYILVFLCLASCK